MTDSTLTLRDAEAHHALRVLRIKPGEEISAADDSGRLCTAVVTKCDDEVTAEVGSVFVHTKPKPAMTIYQALVRGARFDYTVQKCTELNADRIVPFVAERSIVKLNADKVATTVARWQQIAIAAAKQCRSVFLTKVDTLQTKPPGPAGGPRIVLHESASDQFRAALPDKAPDEISFVIGPEGGLTDNEVRQFQGQAVTLGPRVLRTETAGPIVLALASYHYGLLG